MTLFVAGAVIVAVGLGANHLRRTRSHVMDYHHIRTPRINEPTRGGDGGGGGGG